MATHIIRLRGPWECEQIAPDRTRYARRFGLPTNLGPHEQVWVVIERSENRGTALLNDTPLGEIGASVGPVEFDVTRLLGPRNLLVLEMETPNGGPTGEVRLEIRGQTTDGTDK